MAENKRRNPFTWQMPNPKEPVDKRQLKLHNSFTKKKELFLSNDRKTVKWYCCGPTVYDVAHLGHARCYMTFDIIRRIMSNYFGYHVFYVMNITDIDDKIIKRARSSYLCDKFIRKTLDDLFDKTASTSGDSKPLLDEIGTYIDNFKARRLDEKDPDKLKLNETTINNSKVALNDLSNLLTNTTSSREDVEQALKRLSDVIADEQDALLGHTVEDHQIFKNLTLQYEQEFHNDMQKLDIMPPSALTRVSEYIDETGAFISKLEQNEFAYRSGGSIYFDTEKFDSDEKHSYAKLVREAYGQKKGLDEGEGELSVSQVDKKKSPNDFALWKKSKIGEPSWQTQDFEPGRPGWHIECSVMASKMLGDNFDIHSGGHDLRFPHHDNEIAQAEAFYNTGKNWVNYFIHSGHLTISGCKMSKSLKNFITIRQALQDYTSRQLRFAFLAHGWTETLDYSPNTMKTALTYEKTFSEFFLNTADTLRRQISSLKDGQSNHSRLCDQMRKWSEEDHRLNQKFQGAINKVDTSLCDNFDTRGAMNVMSALVKECNKRKNTDIILLKDIADFIKRILSVFGAKFDEINLDRLFADQSQSSLGDETSAEAKQDYALQYVEALAGFRADVRKSCKSEDAIKQILNLCDSVRDMTLPDLGVRLEDRQTSEAPYVVKFVDRETLIRERERKQRK